MNIGTSFRLFFVLMLGLTLRLWGHTQPVAEQDAQLKQALGLTAFSHCRIVLPEQGLPEQLSVKFHYQGQLKHLKLRRHSVRSPSFQLLVQHGDGTWESLPPPPSRTYQGTVAGEPGSLVAASLLPEGLTATIIRNNALGWTIRPVKAFIPDSPREKHIIYTHDHIHSPTCGCCDAAASGDHPRPPSSMPGSSGRTKGCTVKVADVAFDADYEHFEDDCNSDPDTYTAIVEAGLNVTNLIYIRDVRIMHRLSAAILRDDPETDFYAVFPDASDFGAMLVAFRDEWNENMQHIDYDTAYLLTGKSRPEYGGLAYVRAMCGNYRYGMGLGGWGFEGIFRHEVGHNWGCGHSCGTERRYIMCGNSIDAISAYHIKVITEYAAGRSCLEEMVLEDTDPAPPYVRMDPVVCVQGQGPVPIYVLDGDTDLNCDDLQLVSFDAESSFGAAIQVIDAFDPGGKDGLLYSPRSDFVGTDYFNYVVSDGTGFEVQGVVIVKIQPRGMIAYLKLDETEGDEAEDSSGYGFEGECEDALTFDANATDGKYGGAIQLNAVDGEYISIDDDPMFDLRQGLTVAAWFTVDGFEGEGESLVAKGSSTWRLKRDGTNGHLKLTCSGLSVTGASDGNLIGSTPVNDGLWHHAVGVYDGERVYLYIDGELDNSLPASGWIDTTSSSVRIGYDQWHGAIDEVRIYNYGLSEAQVVALYQDTRIENPSPADGTRGVLPESPLTWISGPSADGHDVYFGTDRNAVSAADVNSPQYQGRHSNPEFTPGITPDSAQYYWRVDTVTGGQPNRGDVLAFTPAFAFSGFDEPAIDAHSFVPGPGDLELGFASTWTATGGDDPHIGVIETGTTPTTPIFSHRSLEATTTFDPVDLMDRPYVSASLSLQIRSTGYEEEEYLDVYLTSGEDRVSLVNLSQDAAINQLAGQGYARYAARVPGGWDAARLVLESASNSGSASERYDFDSITFFCNKPHKVMAFTHFNEPDINARSYTPGEAGRELGFHTTVQTTGGTDPYAGIVASGTQGDSKFLRHRSVNAVTTFDAVDLAGSRQVLATVVLRIHDTGYESGDRLLITLTDGDDTVNLLNLMGDTGIEALPKETYISFSARIPAGWPEAALTISSISNSSAGAEGYEFRSIEFLETDPGDPCIDDAPPGPFFRRGDTNASGGLDLADAIFSLAYLFSDGPTPPCLDAADSNDDGTIDLSDPIMLLTHLFGDVAALPAPFADCGLEAMDGDSLDCEAFPPCQ